jgi:hypothetical protein
LLGLTSRELIGKNDSDFFPESQAAFFTRKDREVLASGVEANIPASGSEVTTGQTSSLYAKTAVFSKWSAWQPVYLMKAVISPP